MEVRGAYSNVKGQVRALEELREKLPILDTPEPPSIKRDPQRRVRQLDADQVEELIAGYPSDATVCELGDRFGIERRTGQQHPPSTRRTDAPPWSPPTRSTRSAMVSFEHEPDCQ